MGGRDLFKEQQEKIAADEASKKIEKENTDGKRAEDLPSKSSLDLDDVSAWGRELAAITNRGPGVELFIGPGYRPELTVSGVATELTIDSPTLD